MFEHYEAFLDRVFTDIEKMGIDVSHFDLDHIAYTADSSEEYNKLKEEMLQMGQLVGEDIIGGRRVSVVKLNKELEYQTRHVPGFELIEPAEGKPTISRLDHIEFVVPTGLTNLKDRYPLVPWNTESMDRPEYPHLKVYGLSVKFHELSIFETIEKQHSTRKEHLK